MPQINTEFAENPEPRCACVLLLDTSSSMSGPPIAALNDGLKTFEQEIKKDGVARKRVEIAVITFGDQGVQKIQDFVTADGFAAPHLSVGGSTPMGGAIQLGLDMIRDRKQEYKDAGIVYYRPWMFMITDGGPDSMGWNEAAARVEAELRDKRFEFYAVGVAGANTTLLGTLTPRVLALDGIKFGELFVWLSQSFKEVAHSSTKPGTQVATPPVNFGTAVIS